MDVIEDLRSLVKNLEAGTHKPKKPGPRIRFVDESGAEYTDLMPAHHEEMAALDANHEIARHGGTVDQVTFVLDLEAVGAHRRRAVPKEGVGPQEAFEEAPPNQNPLHRHVIKKPDLRMAERVVVARVAYGTVLAFLREEGESADGSGLFAPWGHLTQEHRDQLLCVVRDAAYKVVQPGSSCSGGNDVFRGRDAIQKLFHHTAMGLVRAIVGPDEYGKPCRCDQPRNFVAPEIWAL